MKKFILLVTLLTVSGTMFAGQKNLYQGEDFDGVPPDFLATTAPATYRDGVTPCSYGCLIQGIIEYESDAIRPPVTNDSKTVSGYYIDYPDNSHGAYNIGTTKYGTPHPYREGNCGTVGSRNGLATPNPTSPGNYKMGVIGINNKLGWLRIFSEEDWTSSAYYGDGTQWSLPDSPNYGSAGNIVCSNVNPAYVIPFDFIPKKGEVVGTVTGSVYSSISGDTNQLETGWILIEWRQEGETSWTTATETLSAEGNFSFVASVLEPTNIYVRARVKDAYTPRAGFPISVDYPIIDAVPEPFSLLLLIGCLSLIIRKKM